MNQGRPRNPGEHVTTWAEDTGRISAAKASEWRTKIARDPSLLAVYERMAPVLAAGCAEPINSQGVVCGFGAAERLAASGASTRAGRPSADGRPAYARNPIVEHLAATSPDEYQRAANCSPAPTLFHGGDVPAFTASGVDPVNLLQVPWQARHALATMTNRAAVERTIEALSGEGGPDLALVDYGRDADNQDYAMRVQEWVLDGAQAADAAAKPAPRPGAPKSPEDMTDDETYDSIFGHSDRQDAARREAHEQAILSGSAVGHYTDLAQVRAARAAREAHGGAR